MVSYLKYKKPPRAIGGFSGGGSKFLGPASPRLQFGSKIPAGNREGRHREGVYSAKSALYTERSAAKILAHTLLIEKDRPLELKWGWHSRPKCTTGRDFRRPNFVKI